MRAISISMLLLAGCGNLLGIEDLGGPAAPVDGSPDGGPDGPLGGVTISGRVLVSDVVQPPTPPDGIQLELVRDSDKLRLASTTSSNGGTYTLTVPPPGELVDGFIRATTPGAVLDQTIVFLDRITASVSIDVPMFGHDFIRQQLAPPYMVGHSSDAALVLATITDANKVPLQNVRLDVAPATFPPARYDGNNNQPNPNATMTGPNGRAYVFNLPAANMTGMFSSTINGSTIGPRTIAPVQARTVYIFTLHP